MITWRVSNHLSNCDFLQISQLPWLHAVVYNDTEASVEVQFLAIVGGVTRSFTTTVGPWSGSYQTYPRGTQVTIRILPQQKTYTIPLDSEGIWYLIVSEGVVKPFVVPVVPAVPMGVGSWERIFR